MAEFLLHLLAAVWADYRRQAVCHRLVVKAVFLRPVEVRVAFHLPEEALAVVPLADMVASRPGVDTVDALPAGVADNKVADSPGSILAAARASRDSRNTRFCGSKSRRRPSASPSRSPNRNSCC